VCVDEPVLSDDPIPRFVGIPAPTAICCSTAYSDVHWASLTVPLRLLDWWGWGRASEGSTPPRSTPTRCSTIGAATGWAAAAGAPSAQYAAELSRRSKSGDQGRMLAVTLSKNEGHGVSE
jgi:hypothetical protein